MMKHGPSRTPLLLLAAGVLLSAACGPRTAVPTEASSPPTPPPAARLEHGIDVSDHSGSIEWAKVREAGFDFAFVKATEGVDLRDPTFADHWKALKAAGLVRGAYHFYVSEDAPAEQARWFIDTVTLEPGDLVPVVDVELIGHGTPPGLARRLRTWLDLVEAHYGVKPIIYTAPNFWNAHLDDAFGDHPLWVAEYDTEEPRLPAGWKTWHLWQWKEDAEVAGVEKGADLSRINLTTADLALLMIPE